MELRRRFRPLATHVERDHLLTDAQAEVKNPTLHEQRTLWPETLLRTKFLVIDCIEELAKVVEQRELILQAVRLWGAAEALRHAMKLPPLSPDEAAQREGQLVALRTQMDDETFKMALHQGYALTPEQILSEQEQFFSAYQASSVQKNNLKMDKPRPSKFSHELTGREIEVLRLVTRGWTDAQIAEQLIISQRTVNSHLTSIYRKIHVTTRSAATRYAMEHRLI